MAQLSVDKRVKLMSENYCMRERESALAVAWRGRWDKKVDVCVSVGGRRRWGALVSCVDRDGTYEYLTIWPPIVENIINENQT